MPQDQLSGAQVAGKMIDNFSLLLTHGLILLACWRLLSRPDLDSDHPAENRGFLASLRAKDSEDA